MPLKLDIERILNGKSERVKSVDIHPKEPWILSALYSGNVYIWNYETGTIARTFEVSDVPVRVAKFIVRKNWFVCGSDDMHIRIYNYNTCEKIKEFEGHTDYIRSLAIHPSLPYVLSGSDDMSIKLWDWSNNWDNKTIFEGHTHYVMQVEINPKDTNSFASASLDRSIKIWGFNSSMPHFQLEGHERGVNCVSYYQGGERPFLVSGADDNLVKIWDYQTKTCIATLEGHSANISSVMFHPGLPIVISGSEDGSIKIWHSNTYRLETTLHYNMERVWNMSCMLNSNKIAIGFDEGTIMIKLGQENPVVSMDSLGKIIWAKNHEVQGVNLRKSLKSSENHIYEDGEIIPVSPDDLGSIEFYPNSISHNKNGQLVAICGDGEYSIYTALQLKHKSFGSCLDFVWGNKAHVYAVRESKTKIKIYEKFKDYKTIKLSSGSSDMIFGGYLLGIRCPTKEKEVSGYIDFYSWKYGKLIRRIEVNPNKVIWSDNGNYVALICDDNYYILKFNEDIVNKILQSNEYDDVEYDYEQGIDSSFTLEKDINESVLSASFQGSGEILIYTTNNCRINYYVGGQVITLSVLNNNDFYILGYLQSNNSVYLIDKQYNIYSYKLLKYILAYQAAIVRGDFKKAKKILLKKKDNNNLIPLKYYNKISIFLENQGYIKLALQVSQMTNDKERQFELCLQLKKLKLAKQILINMEINSKNENDKNYGNLNKQNNISNISENDDIKNDKEIIYHPSKWKQLCDLAIKQLDFKTCEECAIKSNDLSTLFLLYTSILDKSRIYNLAKQAIKLQRFDIGFNCLFILGEKYIPMILNDILLKNDRIPEAAFLARSFIPSKIDDIHKIWVNKLKDISPSAAKSLGNTSTHNEYFNYNINNNIKFENNAEESSEPVNISSKNDDNNNNNININNDSKNEDDDDIVKVTKSDINSNEIEKEININNNDNNINDTQASGSDEVSMPSGVDDPDDIENVDIDDLDLDDLDNME